MKVPPVPSGVAAHAEHGVWEAIADSFDRNRTRTWPHVEAFLRALPPGSRVLDLMGGNGRHTRCILEAGHRPVWLDWSRPAARIVAKRYPAADVLVAEATRLPAADGAFDACIFVAGLHCLPTATARRAALRELRRVLRPGGVAQVTVWSRDAPRFRAEGTPGQPLDVVLPWRSDGHDEPRPYHLYTPGALATDLHAEGFTLEGVASTAVVAREPDNLVATVRALG
ncbi:MAG TPA: class I SAM-dependent methyltransferase [Candidatus Thermoplasmatota archaeon]|nr:class I SAM-dependent methyltransferase [Candidatus Thermoplasmatota archaeon]